MNNSNHLDLISNNLRNRIGRAVNEAYENLIPPWCYGIQDSLWSTPTGKELGLLFWCFNHDQAISIREALDILFPELKGNYSRRQRSFIQYWMRYYPRVDEFYWQSAVQTRKRKNRKNALWYVRKDDAEALHSKILAGEFKVRP